MWWREISFGFKELTGAYASVMVMSSLFISIRLVMVSTVRRRWSNGMSVHRSYSALVPVSPCRSNIVEQTGSQLPLQLQALYRRVAYAFFKRLLLLHKLRLVEFFVCAHGNEFGNALRPLLPLFLERCNIAPASPEKALNTISVGLFSIFQIYWKTPVITNYFSMCYGDVLLYSRPEDENT